MKKNKTEAKLDEIEAKLQKDPELIVLGRYEEYLPGNKRKPTHFIAFVAIEGQRQIYPGYWLRTLANKIILITEDEDVAGTSFLLLDEDPENLPDSLQVLYDTYLDEMHFRYDDEELDTE